MIGNDIDDISWDIFAKHEVPESFVDAENIEVFARLASSVRKIEASYTIAGNRLKLVIPAERQKKTGVYDLELTYQKPDSLLPGGLRHCRVTSCAVFELRDKSCELDLPDDPLVVAGIIAPLRGYSAYEVAIKNGFEGSEVDWLESLEGKSFTYEDFTPGQIEDLKRPAIDAAAAANTAAGKANGAAANAAEKAVLAATAAGNAQEQADRLVGYKVIGVTRIGDEELNEI